MHFSIIIPALLSSSALGLAVPQAEDSKLIERFGGPGASLEEGFTTSEDTTSGGSYRVQMDDDEVANHTKVDMNLESIGVGDDTSSAFWRVTCEGSSLNETDADIAINLLITGCGSGHFDVPPYDHYYIISGKVASYFCNNSSGQPTCNATVIREQIRDRVSGRCGDYKAGWARWDGSNGHVSVGYQNVDSENFFCGRNH
ncbi:aryl-alcohol dehydrogenase [Fusarium subglutinans]|uniref:Aryl-alcohol dehydrogenase n=1 Tax=Gibberella subglutinans TaxID=42677 RepID=A0A8H5P3E2_GIBSU|nr:aryl-alcohol dehydrogenase [Fusarium subglutinans]KAF5588279.1 aryl-alcohol dehydrogenase [Fusarium subglutinans]